MEDTHSLHKVQTHGHRIGSHPWTKSLSHGGNADMDEARMRHALSLAARGQGAVEPNPMVGAIVCDVAGNIVGKGWHQQFGGPHAEVYALQNAGEAARGGTLYVTLEPCSHHGKTPPCTDAVLASGVRRVVVAMRDPFPEVAGRGIAILSDNGLSVEVGLLQEDAVRLNAPYLKRLREGKPWVIAKWAMTLDGKIATATGDSQWISNPESRALVHQLRGRVDAIVVGANTLRHDDPFLTARPPGIRTPRRVVVTRSGNLPSNARLLRTAKDVPVTIVTLPSNRERLKPWHDAGAELHLVDMDARGWLSRVLQQFGEQGMTNILVEGGAKLLGTFHDAHELDEVWTFIAPMLFGGSGPSPVAGDGVSLIANARRGTETTIEAIGQDCWIRTRFLPLTPNPSPQWAREE